MCDCPAGIPAVVRSLGLDPAKGIPTLEGFRPLRQTDPKARRAAEQALEATKRWISGSLRTLMLSGMIGVGKTHLARAAAISLRLSGRPVGLLTGRQFERIVMDFETPREERAVRVEGYGRWPAMVFDDLGAGTNSGNEMVARLENVFDDRCDRELQTLVTTNLNEGDLAKAIGARSFDRLMAHGELVLMPGESQRGR